MTPEGRTVVYIFTQDRIFVMPKKLAIVTVQLQIGMVASV